MDWLRLTNMKKKAGFCISTGLMIIMAMAGTISGQGQVLTVSGVVRDSATHSPLSNVSVYFKNGGRGRRTDANGKFSLSADKEYADLVISIVGYRQRTIHLNATTGSQEL